MCVQNNDTVYRQKQFTSNLNQVDSMGYYTIQDYLIYMLLVQHVYLKINKDNSIEIFRDTSKTFLKFHLNTQEYNLNFILITNIEPNSVVYKKSKTLIGNYSLLDSSNNIVSKDFTIQ